MEEEESFFFFGYRLIIWIHYNLGLLHFLIIKYLGVWWLLCVCGWNIFFITPLGILRLKNIVIPNYNGFKLLMFTQKLKEPLSTRLSACSEARSFLIGVFFFLIKINKRIFEKRKEKTNKQKWDHAVRKANSIKKKLKTFKQESGPIINQKKKKNSSILLAMF